MRVVNWILLSPGISEACPFTTITGAWPPHTRYLFTMGVWHLGLWRKLPAIQDMPWVLLTLCNGLRHLQLASQYMTETMMISKSIRSTCWWRSSLTWTRYHILGREMCLSQGPGKVNQEPLYLAYLEILVVL